MFKKDIIKLSYMITRMSNFPDDSIEIIKGKDALEKFEKHLLNRNFYIYGDHSMSVNANNFGIHKHFSDTHMTYIYYPLKIYILEGKIYIFRNEKEYNKAKDIIFENLGGYGTAPELHSVVYKFNRILTTYSLDLGLKTEIVENLKNSKGKEVVGLNEFITDLEGKYLETICIKLNKELYNLDKDLFNVITVRLHEIAHTLCNMEIGPKHTERDADIRAFILARDLFANSKDFEVAKMYEYNFTKFYNAFISIHNNPISETKKFKFVSTINPYALLENNKLEFLMKKFNKKDKCLSLTKF